MTADAYAGGTEEWEVRFTDPHFVDPQPYRPPWSRRPPAATEEEAMADIADARNNGYEGVTLRRRYLSPWMDVKL